LANHAVWGVCEPALKLQPSWEGRYPENGVQSRGSEPDSGNPTVRDRREACGNMGHGGTVNPLCNRKGRAGNPPPKVACAAFLSRHLHAPFDEAGTGDGAMARTEAPAVGRKPPATATPRRLRPPRQSSTLPRGGTGGEIPPVYPAQGLNRPTDNTARCSL